MFKSILMSCLLLLSSASFAQLEVYDLDPAHTYPSFEADHMGISVWRGKINTSSGTVSVDSAKETGTLSVVMDMASIDFGHKEMNKHARSSDIFDVEQQPQATYKGQLVAFNAGLPQGVQGTLTLNGVSKPVYLNILSMRCITHPMAKRKACGADAFATINRADFGITAGKKYGFDMTVTLRIQVEALIREE